MNRLASFGLLAPLFAAGLFAAGCADAPTAADASFSGKPSNHEPRLTCQSSTMGTITLRAHAGQDSLDGFSIQWISEEMHSSNGNWDSAATATFAAPNYALAPNGSVSITFGDPFTLLGATGDTTDLECGMTYHFRFITTDSAGALDTSDVVECTTAPCDDNQQDSVAECTRGLGWWKNHPEEWPVDSLTVGGITYSKAQLLQILSSPIRGSKLQILARQLIVAKLNVERTGDTTATVLAAIASLDSAIGNRRIPPVGNGSLNTRDLERFSDLLEQFNEGEIGPGDCDEIGDNHDSDDDNDDDDDDDRGGNGNGNPTQGPGNNGRGHAYGHMLRDLKSGR